MNLWLEASFHFSHALIGISIHFSIIPSVKLTTFSDVDASYFVLLHWKHSSISVLISLEKNSDADLFPPFQFNSIQFLPRVGHPTPPPSLELTRVPGVHFRAEKVRKRDHPNTPWHCARCGRAGTSVFSSHNIDATYNHVCAANLISKKYGSVGSAYSSTSVTTLLLVQCDSRL